MKQETLEEAAVIRYGSDQYLWAKQRDGFVEGAKWQQERSYSEEEAGELIYNVIEEYAKRENIFFKGDLINNLFEQFKKK